MDRRIGSWIAGLPSARWFVGRELFSRTGVGRKVPTRCFFQRTAHERATTPNPEAKTHNRRRAPAAREGAALAGGRHAAERGARIAQLVVARYVPVRFDEVETLEETERGAGGFGSTGRE